MSETQTELIETLFEQAVELPADQRDQFLQARCDDENIRREVSSLLGAHDRAGSFLGRSALEDGALQEIAGDPNVGRTIGPYRITELIATGGMGAVYRAERWDDAYQKTVAIKLIRAGLDGGEILHRFRRERQVLANLDHPNIARLIDGGSTEPPEAPGQPPSRPYLVMEYVPGTRIDHYADEHHLSIDQRLDLFMTVCDALQHAHGNLVIHRDLKPGNILVTADGTVKLLDFGIAKMLTPDDPDSRRPDVTTTIERRLTPAYASPEQVRGEAITTATDIYSLGVILYELLAGTRPYEVSSGSTPEDAKKICETEPPRPSRRLEAASADATTDLDAIARQRGLEPPALRRTLRGDLDHIIMTALRKEPQRRYATVQALREDISRYRRRLPVSARPDSWGYRTRKFIARNRGAVAAAAMLVIVLVAAVITTSRQAAIAQEQRRQAEAALATSDTVGRFLRSMLLAANPRQAGQAVTMRDALDQATLRIEEELGGSPIVEARVREAVGSTYRTLGLYEQAENHLVRAAELARLLLGDDLETARIEHELASLRLNQGRLDEARALIQRVYEFRRDARGPLTGDTLEARKLLATIYMQQGQIEQSLAHCEAIVADWKKLLDGGDPRVLEAKNTLGKALNLAQRYEEAAAVLREVYDGQIRALGDDHPDTLISASDLGVTLVRAGDREEGLDLQMLAADGLARHFSPGSLEVVIPRINIASALNNDGRFEQARDLLRQAIVDGSPSLGEGHYVIAAARLRLAVALSELGELTQAIEQAEIGHGVLLDAFGPDHRFTLDAAATLSKLSGQMPLEQ